MTLAKTQATGHAESMLMARPPRLFTQNYDVTDGEDVVASVRFHLFSQNGEIEMSGRTLMIDRKGFTGPFQLHAGPRRLASAERPSLVRRRWVISAPDAAPIELTPTSWSIRNVTVRQGGVPIGSISRTSVVRREARIDLPEELSIELRMFCFWLVALLWRRAAQSSG